MDLKTEDKLILAAAAFIYLAPNQAGAAAVNVGAAAGTAAVNTATGVLQGAAQASFDYGYQAGQDTQINITRILADLNRESRMLNQNVSNTIYGTYGSQTLQDAFPEYNIYPVKTEMDVAPQIVDRFKLGWNISPLGALWALR